MADCESDVNAFNYPSLFQDMKLSTKGGPLYRGGRGGRATAAYYREREAATAAKMKFGRRYGRRIQAYKPDSDLWKSCVRHQESFEIGNLTFDFTPGGLQGRKYSVQDELKSLTKITARKDLQGTVSLKCHTNDRSLTVVENKKVFTKTLNASNFQTPELKRPSLGGRGVMRGRRMIDVATISSTIGTKTDVTANDNMQMVEPGSATRANDTNTKELVPSHFSSQLIKLVETMNIH